MWLKRRRCCCTLRTSCLWPPPLLEINCILRIAAKCLEFLLQKHWLGRGSALLFSFSLSRDSDSATAPNHPPTHPAERPTNQQCNVVFRQQALSVCSINQLRCISSLPETKHPPPPPPPLGPAASSSSSSFHSVQYWLCSYNVEGLTFPNKEQQLHNLLSPSICYLFIW